MEIIEPTKLKVEKGEQLIVYHFVDELGIPFYVGITSNLQRRMNEHNRSVRINIKYHVYHKIRKLIKEKKYVLKDNVHILHKDLARHEANLKEIEIIADYKMKGYKMSNISPGGNSQKGIVRIVSDETKAKLSLAKKRLYENGYISPTLGRKMSNEEKEKRKNNGQYKQQSERMKGENNPFRQIKQTTERSEALRLTAIKTFKGSKQSEAHKQKRKEAQIKTIQERMLNPEYSKVRSEINRRNGLSKINMKRKLFKVTLPTNEELSFKGTQKELRSFILQKGLMILESEITKMIRLEMDKSFHGIKTTLIQ